MAHDGIGTQRDVRQDQHPAAHQDVRQTIANASTPLSGSAHIPRVLITGGAGYVGGRLVEALACEGFEPIILTRDRVEKECLSHVDASSQYQIVIADVADPSAVNDAFRQAGRVDAVIHLAAVNEHVCAKDPALAFKVNCFGTQHVLEAAVGAGVSRFIYLSTFHVYGDVRSPISEESVPNPMHPYGLTHYVAEQFCKAAAKKSGLDIAIIRFSNGVGAPAHEKIDRWMLVMLDLCRQAHENGSLTLQTPGFQERDFVSFGDLSQAVLLLLRADASALKPQVFNVGSGHSVTIRDVAHIVKREYHSLYDVDIPLNILSGNSQMPSLSSQKHTLEFNIDRIKRLGYVPTTDIAAEARATLRFCERFRKTE